MTTTIKFTNDGCTLPENLTGSHHNFISCMCIQYQINVNATERYVVDEKGHRVAVILPMEEYEKLQEDLHDLAVVAGRRDEKSISLEEMKKHL